MSFIMNILDLINEKYSDKEYTEIKKLINIKNQNIIMLDNLETITTTHKKLLNALTKQMHIKNKEIENLNDEFLENNRLFQRVSLTAERENRVESA